MFSKYLYKEQDITTDTLFKIERILSIIAEKENVPFEEAYRKFLESKVYGMLQRTSSLMWAENAEFIVDEYYREIEANPCLDRKNELFVSHKIRDALNYKEHPA